MWKYFYSVCKTPFFCYSAVAPERPGQAAASPDFGLALSDGPGNFHWKFYKRENNRE